MKSGAWWRGDTKRPMAEYRFTSRAAMDLEAIAEYTIERFGIDQARRYRDELAACFEQLTDHPGLGRRYEQLGAGLRRYEHRSHIIFHSGFIPNFPRSRDEMNYVTYCPCRTENSGALAQSIATRRVKVACVILETGRMRAYSWRGAVCMQLNLRRILKMES